ncbi:hypothetical protein BCR42DRAFT_198184 [Absidia repens]|uniref:Agmatine deiminase n=1 Tax=Absidia repens TaxID=90262 RepID=A0A1X2HYR0_9FUNG|nr:hypothetical protein BCR42DRAFT_198184 [Absidia repens]
MKELSIVTVIICLISAIMACNTTLVMPEEGNPHKGTWMAYGATTRTWGTSGSFGANRLIARKDLMRIAANIARFEQVFMIVDNEDDEDEARDFLDDVLREHDGSVFTGGKQLPAVQSNNIKFLVHPVDDLWIRDTGAVFVTDERKSLYGIDFNFNGWGQENTGAQGWKKDPKKAENGIEDQVVSNDRRIAGFTIAQANATKVSTWLVLEGGGIEVDGKGTAVCTESCILNENRNPGKTKTDVEAELHRTLGVKKVVWLPGAKAKDITDGHVDFYARFSKNGHIIYTLDNDKYSSDYETTAINKNILQNVTDVHGNKLTPVALKTPDSSVVRAAVTKRNGWNSDSSNFDDDTFAASYIGYYASDKFLLMAQYGDPAADLAAFNILKNIFPEKTIMQITTDGISSGGGTIHCSTQQQII